MSAVRVVCSCGGTRKRPAYLHHMAFSGPNRKADGALSISFVNTPGGQNVSGQRVRSKLKNRLKDGKRVVTYFLICDRCGLEVRVGHNEMLQIYQGIQGMVEPGNSWPTLDIWMLNRARGG